MKCIYFAGALSVLLLASGCRKATVVVTDPPDSAYSGRIRFVFEYNNGTFGNFYAYLQSMGAADTLASKGPFTVFAPDNAAPDNFLVYGDVSVYSGNPYTLDGYYPLAAIPVGQTAIFTEPGEYKLFVTAHASGDSILYTANGAPIQTADQKASNGLIQILSAYLPPYYYPTPLQAIQSNLNLSIFAYALQRCHKDTVLNDSVTAYTVLAPNNAAMEAIGYTFDSVQRANPDSLAVSLIGYHILPGRYFLYDFDLLSNNYSLPVLPVNTLNGLPVQVITSPGAFPQFSGVNNASAANPFTGSSYYNISSFYDVPAGNSVVQEIDQVLIP